MKTGKKIFTIGAFPSHKPVSECALNTIFNDFH
jgi:hypothetical protein